jgi:type II secretory pathway component PulF
MADLTAPLAQLAEGAEADEQEAAVRFERGCILALYLFLGGTVAVAVIAIYLPIFRLGSII